MNIGAARKKNWTPIDAIARCLASFFLFFLACASAAEEISEPEKAAMLALPWLKFDQTYGSGWRVLFARKQYLQAAELIEVYLRRHDELIARERAVSHMHAAQNFARAGRTEAALAHLDKASISPGTKNMSEDWNELVISMRAFLIGDRDGLVASKRRVSAMTSPAFPDNADELLSHFGKRYGIWWDEDKTDK